MNTSDYSVISPVWGWHAEQNFKLPSKVRVEQIFESERPVFQDWSEALSGRQIKELSGANFWFRYDIRGESSGDMQAQTRAMELVRNAALAYQVMCPVGSFPEGSFVCLCEKKQGRLFVSSFAHNRRMETTQWGRMLFPHFINLVEFPVVVKGVQEAFAKRVVRLQNPLYFLELGLEANNPHIRTVLCVTGLDALLMAGGKSVFEQRLCNFLGQNEFVFPPTEDSQPKYKVGDVAHDLYELRNKIAHGLEIPNRFREAIGFENDNGRLIEGYKSNYQRRHVLEEAALFLLCSALKTVFTRNLTDVVGDSKRWRDWLESPPNVGNRP